jgi:hypothetical protein
VRARAAATTKVEGKGDAIIAATSVENALPLMSANAKHFRPIKELDLVVFRP